jgi:O-antigen/teichoic acid export membrane protein
MLVTTFAAVLLIAGLSMAVVYKIIPVQAAALISVIGLVTLTIAAARRPQDVSQAPSQSEPVAVLRVIWPLLLGAIVGIIGVWSNGWRVGDSIGAVVCFLLLTAYLVAFRKQRPKLPPGRF